MTDWTPSFDAVDGARRGLAEDRERRLADLLVRRGLADAARIERLRAAGPLGPALLADGLLTEDGLARLWRELDAGAPAAPSIDHYDLIERIGVGGMGTVHKAFDRKLQRIVAIKMLRADAPTTGAARLLREAEAVARLRHPNIITVYGAGEHEGSPYLVMEYVDGRPLGRRGPLDGTLRTLVKAMRAVAVAHRNGVVHRDLKPANVLVDAAGEPHVLDFGLAHLVDADVRLTRTGTTLGTPQYMAPEQVSGRGDAIRPATDVYALGAMLYEIVAGRPPHVGRTPQELYAKILAEDPPPLEASRDLSTICMKAIDKAPERRYATAGELADDIERFLRHEAVLAKPASLLSRWGQRVRRHRLATGLVAGVVLAAAVGGIVVGVQRSRAVERARTEARSAWEVGAWEKCLVHCEEVLRHERDDALAGLADACRRRIAEGAAKAREQARRLRTAGELGPVRERLKSARLSFYVPQGERAARAALAEMEAELRRLHELEEECGEFAEFWATLGTGWYLVGDASLAERALLEAGRRGADDPAVALYLGKIYLDRSILQRVCDSQQSSAMLQENLRRSNEWAQEARKHLAEPRAGGATELDLRLAAAYRAYADGRYDDVLRLCEDGLSRSEVEPGVEEFWLLRGWALSARGGGDPVDAFTRAIARRPYYPAAYLARGLVRWFVEPGPADADFTTAIEMNARMPEAFMGRALSRVRRGLGKDAEPDTDEAIRLRPDFPEALVLRAGLRSVLSGDFAAAFTDLDRAARLRPGYVSAYVLRGDLLMDPRCAQRDPAGAVAAYSEAIALKPGHAEFWRKRARARHAAGDTPGAEKDLAEARTLEKR